MAHYPLTITEDGDSFLVTSPKLPEVTSTGKTREEAEANGTNAVLEAIAARIRAGKVVPTGRVMMARGQGVARVTRNVEAKINLHNTMTHHDISRADLARKLAAKSEATVDELLSLDHLSTADDLEAAFSAMGYDPLRRL